MRKNLAASVSGLALACGVPNVAFAQSEGVEPEGNYNAGVIVVTAQFREQTVQSTPLSISALDSRLLDQKGVTDIAAAANIAPNVQLTANATGFGGMAAIFVRGVGQADPHFAAEPGVGMYIDDVYYGVLSGTLFELMDLDRVEVLRGPQGTLAGKNSIGGSVKLFSKRPGPDPDGFVEVGYGSRNSILARAASNLTVVEDQLYARISVGAKYSDGYFDRLDYACATGDFSAGSVRTSPDCKIGSAGGQQVFSARGSLLWQPSTSIENHLIFDVTRDRSENPAAKALTQSPLWAGTANYITGPKDYTSYETYESLPTDGALMAGIPFTMSDTTPVNSWGISNNLTIDLSDDLVLTSITGYRASDLTFNVPGDASPASISDQVWSLDHEQFTQEVRLSGQIQDLLDWTVGAYYYTADGASTGRINLPGGLAVGGGGLGLDFLLNDPVDTKSKSVFAHTIWEFVDGFHLTAAARYTDDKKVFTFNRLDLDLTPHPVLGALLDLPVEYKGDRFDYRLGVDYQWTPDFMTYAQVSTGYKGGGVNARPFFVSQALPYNPETLTAFEGGFKSQFADGRLTLNGAAFFNKYKNFQAILRSCDSVSPFAGAPCAQTTNVGDAEIKGFEAELFAEPVDGFTFDGSVGYLDFKYTSVDPATSIGLDMKNVYTPAWTAAAGVQYEAFMDGAGTITPRLDLSYRSGIETNSINSDFSHIGGRTLLNAKVTWKSRDEDWQATAAVYNLADKYYYNSMFTQETAPWFIGTANVGAPRTFLFTIKRMFD